VGEKFTWKIADQDRPAVRGLADALDIPPVVAHLLLMRGIDNADAGKDFLAPSISQLSDPFLLTDMDRAVERITRARETAEKILLFGDYDVDGISGLAILNNAFKRFGIADFTYAMPRRLAEGYGLAPEHVEAAKAEGVSLIVTVDNGISSHEAADRARERGLDLIITDHHTLEGRLPEAVAVVNPRRETPDHPMAHLCGAGVAFKLSTALNGTPNDLDIAALGTVADIVPLLGENRVLVALGLKHMAKYERVGLARLASAARISLQEITSERIGFQLGPRLNAAGRLDDGLMALRLLLSECPDEAGRMAHELNLANEERRQIERRIFEEACEEVDNCMTPAQRSLVLARSGWHAGVIGIVASRLETKYNRPAVLITIDEKGTGRGSARSGPGFNMIEAFQRCQKHLERFGGHKSAAGLSIPEKNIAAFRADFEQEAARQLGDSEPVRELAIDALVSFSEIDSGLIRALEKLEPVGHGNPAPVFCALGVSVAPQSARILKDKHLKLALRQDESVFPAIGFNMAEIFYTEDLSRPVDAAFTPQFNNWRNETTIQLVLRDIRPAEA
jgi:single-stranded-DNA-specific exonuclease